MKKHSTIVCKGELLSGKQSLFLGVSADTALAGSVTPQHVQQSPTNEQKAVLLLLPGYWEVN